MMRIAIEASCTKLRQQPWEQRDFAGRLADYMYYNMDQAVARALVFVGRCK